MRNIWKYVLLFIGVFAVVFIVAAVFFGARYGLGGFGRGMMYNWQYRMPMMGRGGFPLGFGLIRSLIGVALCLIPLGLLALLVGGIVALARRPGPNNPPAQTIATHPVEPAAAKPVVVPPAQMQPETHPCPHCGQPVQNNWVACPYCGGDLKDTAA